MTPTPTCTLVTGGIRSGKSAHAEQLLGEAPAIYLATGPVPGPDDADWQARVNAHRARRPASWRTVESGDVPATLASADRTVLLDSVGTWLARQLDELGAWDDRPGWAGTLGARLDDMVAAVTAFEHDLVIVSEEVGLSLVSEHRAGRLFADWLGTANQRLAAVCDRVVLVVAGCPLVVKEG
ncbi:bifunctional adenosylcobinamide kinase/adenosylcobinamide-phosphate guanylyltransferase [Enemella sp. A6]|uniref:bifunctional adenosylcobinamide kinase/adenosylcobinamide-phosphate guanylyltransferase n=1 Tax=Enemella sp. A6 TaxID=3440152 RepID=UPI003EC032CA